MNHWSAFVITQPSAIYAPRLTKHYFQEWKPLHHTLHPDVMICETLHTWAEQLTSSTSFKSEKIHFASQPIHLVLVYKAFSKSNDI